MRRGWLENWWMLVLVAWAVTAVAAPLFDARVNEIALDRTFAAPAPGLWLGADELGRPIAPRVLAAAGISAPLATGVVAVSLLFGSMLGVLAAWWGGGFERAVIALTDLFMAFPGLLLAIALAGVLGPGVFNVALALSLVGWVGFARIARAQTASLKTRGHVAVAQALGTSLPRVLAWHVLPFVAGPLLVEATFAFATTIAAEAGLSFLGLGAQPPTPTWGNMLREATQFLLVAPHMLLGPAVAIVSLVAAAQAAGERLRRQWEVPR